VFKIGHMLTSHFPVYTGAVLFRTVSLCTVLVSLGLIPCLLSSTGL